jgi:hypothetical protein
MVVSILLWQKKEISSMGLLTYAGVTLVFWSICLSINRELSWDDLVAKWWVTLSGLVYLIALTYRSLMIPAVVSGPLVWGISAGGFAFVWGMSIVYMSGLGDYFSAWFLLTLTAFVPVTLFGAATENLFLLLLGASGLFADSIRFSQYLSDRNGGNGSVPIIFFVLAIAGLGIGAMGMLLTMNQDRIRAVFVKVFSWLETAVRKCFPSEPPRQEHDEDAVLVAVEGA